MGGKKAKGEKKRNTDSQGAGANRPAAKAKPQDGSYMSSKNLSFAFYHEYFEPAYDKGGRRRDPLAEDDNLIAARNERLFQMLPPEAIESPLENPGLDAVDQWFDLTTRYPGLLMGTGIMHDASIDEGIKMGFSLDYVTGLPFLPGSSLKGVLRSYFPKDERDTEHALYIRETLGRILDPLTIDDASVLALKRDIFDNGDVFIGAYPKQPKQGASENQYLAKRMLGEETIAPRKNPGGEKVELNPIKLMKVMPGVQFLFAFILRDYTDPSGTVVTKDQKLDLFRQIVLDMGVGAKTNVGFGRFRE